MKPVEDQTAAELQFYYGDLTRAIRSTSSLTGSGPGKARSTTPAERAHVIRRWQEELHPVVAEMKRRGVEPRVFGARKARRNPQESTWLEYDAVSSRCEHDTPLGEVCLECEEEAEYDLESSAPGRWRERPQARIGEEHLHQGFCRTCGERLTPGHRPGSGVRGPSEHCVIERPGVRRNPAEPRMAMTFGKMPTKAKWDEHWAAYADSPWYDINIGRGASARAADARLGLDGSYGRDELFQKVIDLYNIADAEDDYDGDDSAASWASSIMETLGFEWI